ncbi:MAG: hypothetical protein QF535_23320, partial [Anaerolineales bacterium]|nr:hypothetical protein [Anaerolineales bacterium]
AFALLVQNADEFEAAVGNIQNSAGEATLMADIQQQSLANQIQLVKNALLAPFLFADEVGEANDTLNEFTWRIQQLVQQFTEFFIITMPDGTQALTEHSDALKAFVLDALGEAVIIIERLKEIFLDSGEGLTSFTDLLHMAVQPLHIMLNIIEKMTPSSLAWIVKLKVLNSLLPITNMLQMMGTYIMYQNMAAMMLLGKGQTEITRLSVWESLGHNLKAMSLRQVEFAYYGAATGLWVYEGTMKSFTLTSKGMMVAMGGMISLFMLAVSTTGLLSDVLLGLAIIMALLASAKYIYKASQYGPIAGPILAAAAVITVIGGMIMARDKLQSALSGVGTPGSVSLSAAGNKSKLPTERMYDSGGMFTGGRMYDVGGPTT